MELYLFFHPSIAYFERVENANWHVSKLAVIGDTCFSLFIVFFYLRQVVFSNAMKVVKITHLTIH